MIDQLLLSKRLFLKGEECCEENNPVSAGLAISLFHDSIEILVWSIVKRNDIDVKNSEPFLGLLRKVNDFGVIPHKAKIEELNQARMNFKHYGNLPASEDARKFKSYTEDFLRVSFERFFEEDFDEISLSSLIQFPDVKGYVQQAEKLHTEKDYKTCVAELAKANKLLLSKLERFVPKVDSNLQGAAAAMFDRHSSSQATNIFNYIYKYLEMLRETSIISICGISLHDFVKVRDRLPSVALFGDGTFHVSHKFHQYTEQDSRFLIKFIIDLSLKLQSVLSA